MWVVIESLDASLAKTTHVLLVNKMARPGCLPGARMLDLMKSLHALVIPLSMRATLLLDAFPSSGSNGTSGKRLAFLGPRRLT